MTTTPETLDERHIKECRNKRCPRMNVRIYAPERRYCSTCQAKLKLASWRSQDSPPIHDLGGDSPSNGNGAASIVILAFHEHKGDWASYTHYLTEMGVTEDAYSVNQKILEARRSKAALSSKVTTLVHTPPKPSDTFTCDPDIKGCPIAAKPAVEIPHTMFYKWVYLALAFKTEWIAYLKGHQRPEDGVWIITEMYFPVQKANGAHVDVVGDDQVLEGTIGSVHSHVGMSTFFSNEDELHFNHPVELVVNNRGDISASIRSLLDCKRYSRANASVLLLGNEDEVAARDHLNSKLTQDTAFTTTTSHASPNSSRSYNGHGPSYWNGHRWIEGTRPANQSTSALENHGLAD